MNDLTFESEYWGDCTNTFDEDQKHYVYARGMELVREHYSFPVKGKKILDIGGGPSSMLLKTTGLKLGKVCDPLNFPAWVQARYACKKVLYQRMFGEDLKEDGQWDEAWIYNCLQHTEDPKEILRRARKAAPVVRIFEWIDIPAHEGHPQEITQELLESVLGEGGRIMDCNGNGCFGRAFCGVFRA